MIRSGMLFAALALRAVSMGAVGGLPPAQETGPPGGTPAPESAPNDGTPVQDEASSDPAVAVEVPPSTNEAIEPQLLRRSVFDRPLLLEEITASLTELARAHPRLTTLEPIGLSDRGREIQVLTITDPETGPATEKPGLLAVGFEPSGTTAGAEAVLAFGWTLLERAAGDPEVARLLEDHAVFLAPALDPDVRAGSTSDDFARRSRVVFDRNFPLGWQPDTLRPGSGAFPLSKRETLAVAEFLDRQPALVLVLGGVLASRAAEGPWAGAELPAQDEAVLAALARTGDGAILPWGRLGSHGGGLFDFAYQGRGIYPVAWSRPDPREMESDAESFAAWTRAAAEHSLELLRKLPRVRIQLAELVELAPGLWRLDLAIHNAGSIPTQSVLGNRRGVSGEITLAVRGAILVATARKGRADEPFRSASLVRDAGPEGVLALEGTSLGGGETRWLRLVLEGESGARVDLAAESARGGTARMAVLLR